MSDTAKAAVKAALRAKIRERMEAEARAKADEDEILSRVRHGVHTHERKERQAKVRRRKERLKLVPKQVST